MLTDQFYKADPIDDLIEYAFTTPASCVPDHVATFQSKRVLDNLGCIVAGYDQVGVSAALKLARGWSSKSEATVIGSNEKLAVAQAAFVNAVRARALDFCDVIDPGWHPSSSDVPVALATAELSGASGREMLTALAIGQDFGQRINRAAQANGLLYRGFDANILGLFSGAVIAARLLGLERAAFANAVGLAFDFGIGTLQHYQDKTLAVRISQGLVARHAIEAATMAQAGITGPRRILAGDHGFFNRYAPGPPDLLQLKNELGERFLGEEATCFKLYPHCSIMLGLTDRLLEARKSGELEDAENASITVRVSPTMYMMCGAPYRPADTPEIDAQFSARYVVANALKRGNATIAEFTPKAALDPEIIELAQRVDVVEVSEFSRFDQCEAIFRRPGGRSTTVPVSFGRGWPENPPSPAELQQKFKSCCTNSRAAWRKRSQTLVEAISMLGKQSNVTHLLAAFADESFEIADRH